MCKVILNKSWEAINKEALNLWKSSQDSILKGCDNAKDFTEKYGGGGMKKCKMQ